MMKQVPYKDSHKVVGFNPLVITKAQFCRMMSHVLSKSEKQLEPCWISVSLQIGVQLTLKTAWK